MESCQHFSLFHDSLWNLYLEGQHYKVLSTAASDTGEQMPSDKGHDRWKCVLNEKQAQDT